MAPEGLSAERSRAPWLAAVARDLESFGDDPWAGRWQACVERLCAIASARAIANENALPVRFVDARAVDAPAYEQHIWLSGEVPTRVEGGGAWHDFLNALVWLALPRTKARLNRLQAAAIRRDGVRARRGELRDAATLFDENAVVVLARDGSVDAKLRAHDWRGLFVSGRREFDEGVRVVGFGHALFDKLRAPYKAICAHAWVVAGERAAAIVGATRAGGPLADALPAIDAVVAESLDEASLAPRAFRPLPVLGIPGWWPDNTHPDFYDDEAVFRPARQRRERAPLAGPGPGQGGPRAAT